MRCDECGAGLYARRYPGNGVAERWYVRHGRTCVRYPYDLLNKYAEAVLLAYLGRDDVAHELTAQPVDPAAVAAADEDVARIERDIDDLADRLTGGGPATRRLLDRTLPRLEESLAAAKRRRDELTAPSLLRGLIKPGRDVKRRWKAAPLTVRQEVARILFVPELLGELRLTRPDRPWTQPGPIEQRAMWRRHT